MIAVLKHGTTPDQIDHLIAWLKHMNVDVHISEGKEVTILGLIGDTSRVDMELLTSLEMVSSVKRVSEPFKQAKRKFHPNDSVISIGDVKIDGGHFAMIAGPCSVETEEQIIGVAQAVKAAGAQILRGGAYKPRTSPYIHARQSASSPSPIACSSIPAKPSSTTRSSAFSVSITP